MYIFYSFKVQNVINDKTNENVCIFQFEKSENEK